MALLEVQSHYLTLISVYYLVGWSDDWSVCRNCIKRQCQITNNCNLVMTRETGKLRQ